MPKRYEYVTPPSLGEKNPRPKVLAVGKKSPMLSNIKSKALRPTTPNIGDFRKF